MDGHAQKQGSTVGCGTCARVPISWERPQGQGESWFRTIFPLSREGRLLHPYHCPDLLPRTCSNLPLYAQSNAHASCARVVYTKRQGRHYPKCTAREAIVVPWGMQLVQP